MNVLYILGNGFDKAQGMKTSYPEFYEYLKAIDSETESSLLNLMRKEINKYTKPFYFPHIFPTFVKENNSE